MHEHQKRSLDPYQITAISFLSIIILGTFLLMLPVSSQKGQWLPFIDALFTATSAVCVTGLAVVDIGNYFSLFGQTVIITLIQCGGIGLMTFATLIIVPFGSKINFRERSMLRESLNQTSNQGIIRLVIAIVKMSFAIEFIAGTILAFKFHPEYGVKGIYFGYWHAISAFCNAGFDLFGDFKGLTGYAGDFTVSMTMALLIIAGGLGFSVIIETYRKKHFHALSMHSKLVLTTTLILLLLGTFTIYTLEQHNPATMQNISPDGKLLRSFFLTTSSRTAGFNNIDIDALNNETLFFIILSMFIGASPGSTGGGIKTATFAIIVCSVASLLKGKRDTVVFERRIEGKNIHKAFVVAGLSGVIISAGIFALTIIETKPFLPLLFETVSAFSTTGLSTGITPSLLPGSKLTLSLLMFAGRVGPLTIALALTHREQECLIRYPEEDVPVG